MEEQKAAKLLENIRCLVHDKKALVMVYGGQIHFNGICCKDFEEQLRSLFFRLLKE